MGRVVAVFARSRPRRASGFYFAPGYNPGSGLNELWTTDGVTCTKVWQDPTGGLFGITHLAHATATGKLYIFGDDYAAGAWNNFGVDVYRLDPATNAVTHFAGPYQFGDIPVIGDDKTASHAAEYGGALYVGHQGGHTPRGAYVTKLDLGTGAVTLVAQATGADFIDGGAGGFQPDYTGGLGVRGTTLHWTDGVAIWSGTGGSLTRGAYLGYTDPTFYPPDIDGFGAAGSPVSSPLDGEWYVPGQWAGDETASPDYGYARNAGIDRQIVRHDASVEFNPGCLSDLVSPDQGGAFYNRVACMTVLYDVDDVTPLRLYALDDGLGDIFATDPGVNVNVWRRDAGVWSAETDLQALAPGVRGLGNALKSFKGELYALLPNLKTGSTQLLKRSVGGAWSVFRTFAGYVAESPSQPSFCPVARVSGVVKCHQM